MKAEELASLLEVLERHPRLASARISGDDLQVTFRDDRPQLGDGAPEPEGEPDEQELPDGVFDPRKAIDRVYARDRERRAALKGEAS